jgi:hypothetical protein
MKKHRDMIAIAGGNTNLYKYHEPSGIPTLVVLRNIASADAAGNGITCVCNHRGLLYYGWNDNTASYVPSLGQFNADNPGTPGEFIDGYYVPGIANFKGLFGLESYRDFIYMSGANQWLLAIGTDSVVFTPIVVNDGGVPGAGINFPGLQLLAY